MKNYVIMADGSCDISEEFRTKYDIKYVPSHIMFKDGSEKLTGPTWDIISREEFYGELKKDPTAFTTAPANVEEFSAFFENLVKEGNDVLCLTISTGISGTYGFATKAAQIVMEKYEGAVIKCVDTLRFGPGFGLMCVRAAMLKSEGKSLDDVYEYLQTNKCKFHQMGWLDDLSFCAKKGRLTNAKAFFGTLVGIKPLGEFDYNGLTTVIGKVKGEKKAYDVILNYIENTAENIKDQIVFIAQTDRLQQAEKFKAMLEERFSPKAVYIMDVYAANGMNIGPGLMAAYYVGKPISSNLEEERKLMEKLIGG